MVPQLAGELRAWKLSGVRFANSAWAKVFQMFAGQKPPNPPPPRTDRLSAVVGGVLLVDEHPDDHRVLRDRADEEPGQVVRGGTGLGDDLPAAQARRAALTAVPLTVVSSIAYWTCESCAGVSTWRVATTGVCTAWSGSCHDLMTCAWWNTPLSSMVASICVCSLTVSEALAESDRRDLVEVAGQARAVGMAGCRRRSSRHLNDVWRCRPGAPGR